MTRETVAAGRLAHVSALLDAEQIRFAGLRAAGHEHEILVVEAPASLGPRLATLGPSIRALGFRYVTIDLAATEAVDGRS